MRRYVMVVVIGLLAAGCSHMGSKETCLTDPGYRQARQHKMLQAPPGLNVPQQAPSLAIPAVGTGAPDTGSACLEAPPKLPVDIMVPVAPPSH